MPIPNNNFIKYNVPNLTDFKIITQIKFHRKNPIPLFKYYFITLKDPLVKWLMQPLPAA